MKKISQIIILLLVPIFSNSQSSLAIYKVTYDYEIRQLVNEQKSIEKLERFYLFTNANQSFFASTGRYIRDSIKLANVEKDPFEILELLKEVPRTDFRYTIFKNIRAGESIFTEQILRDKLMYKEVITAMKWKITEEQKEVRGFQCRSATLDFGGRSYIAWYAIDVPIQDGPYKFCGLPGLIIEIEDSTKQHRFYLKGFEKVESFGRSLAVPQDFELVTKQKFLDIAKRIKANPFSEISKLSDDLKISSGGVNVSVQQMDQAYKQEIDFRTYSKLELDEQ